MQSLSLFIFRGERELLGKEQEICTGIISNFRETDNIYMVSKYDRFSLPQNTRAMGIKLSYHSAIWKKGKDSTFFHRIDN